MTTELPADVTTEFVANFTAELATDVAPSLSCSETEALATLLLTLGQLDTAEAWITAHAATGDSECHERHGEPYAETSKIN